MRIVLAGTLLVSTAALAQSLIEPGRLSFAAKAFEPRKDTTPLHCQVQPIPARLSFSFRFNAGYYIRVPMKQYFGPGHGWIVLTRVTPEAGQPVYLISAMKLPEVPKTKVEVEVGGVYVLGEGRYTVDLLLLDDSNRVCRKSWPVEAKLGANERGLKLGMNPETVGPLSFRHWSPQRDSTADVRPLSRLTVLLHAAPVVARSTKFRARDRTLLLGSLASLLESLPARSVRLVVFNLDQQRELFRDDILTPEGFDRAAEAMSNLELGLVDYRILRNRGGHVSLLADLINKELQSADPSDAVVILGPPTRFYDKVPEATIEPHTGAPQFFYFKHRPYFGLGADLPDTIEFATKKLRGKTMEIHTPDEFAKAIKQVEAQISRAN